MCRFFLCALFAALLCGCGDGTVTVTGKVSYQGKPVLSGYVTVLHPDQTATSGVIYPDGTYKVEGVKQGPVKAGVASPDPAQARSILKKGETHKSKTRKTKPGEGGWFPLPATLADPDKSGLQFEVSSSRVQHDIVVK